MIATAEACRAVGKNKIIVCNGCTVRKLYRIVFGTVSGNFYALCNLNALRPRKLKKGVVELNSVDFFVRIQKFVSNIKAVFVFVKNAEVLYQRVIAFLNVKPELFILIARFGGDV